MKNRPDKIIIHCSDSTWGDAAEIDKWHRQRGFERIGYHYVITRDGTIEAGRHVQDHGAHCKGQNTNSIGICLIGKMQFEKIQFDVLEGFLLLLCKVYNIDHKHIYGHYEFSQKTCPNFSVEKFLEERCI